MQPEKTFMLILFCCLENIERIEPVTFRSVNGLMRANLKPELLLFATGLDHGISQTFKTIPLYTRTVAFPYPLDVLVVITEVQENDPEFYILTLLF